jgi:hypothetical protein
MVLMVVIVVMRFHFQIQHHDHHHQHHFSSWRAAAQVQHSMAVITESVTI